MSEPITIQPNVVSAATWEGYGCGAAAAAAESAAQVSERAVRAGTATLDTLNKRGPKSVPVGERATDAERRVIRAVMPAVNASIDLQLAAARACGFSLRNFP